MRMKDENDDEGEDEEREYIGKGVEHVAKALEAPDESESEDMTESDSVRGTKAGG